MNHEQLIAIKPRQVCLHCTIERECYPIYPHCLLKVRDALIRNRWNANNKEKCAASARNWEKNNREKHLARRRKYWADNREDLLEKKAEYREKNREDINRKACEYNRKKRQRSQNDSKS